MKASEMTNEELAARLEKVLPGNYYIDALRSALSQASGESEVGE